jgi:hypothetical protein
MRHSRRKDLRTSDIDNALKSFVIGDNGTEGELDDINESAIPETGNPFQSKVDIEWVNLGSDKTINKEKRFLYDWYKNKNNIEKIAKEDVCCIYGSNSYSFY